MTVDQATEIVRGVAERTGISFVEIIGEDRHRRVVRARQEAYIALRNHQLSYPQIGRLMQRHHTSIMYGVRVALKRQAVAA